MSDKKKDTTPDAELVQPWETQETETEDSAERSLFELLGSHPEFAEDDDVGSDEGEDPDRDGPTGEEDRTGSEEDEFEDEEFEDEFDEDDFEDEEFEDEGEFEDGDEDLHIVKVDGEEIEVPYEELVNGYSRTEYLTRTRQKEAAAHREAMAEVRQTQNEYAEKLDVLTRTLEQMSPEEPDWDALEKANPAEFKREWLAHQKRQKTLQQVRKERDAEQEQQRKLSAEQFEEYANEQVELLQRAIPGWQDEAVMHEEVAELHDYASNTLGFTEQELNSVIDHRLILLLRQAKRGHELERGGKRKLKEKRRRSRKLKPKGRKRSASSRRGRRRRKSSKRVQKRAERVARTGSVKDAARLFEGMLEEGAEL